MESKLTIAHDEENKKKHILRLQEMQRTIIYHVDDKVESSSLLEKIPFLTRFMKGSTDIANQSIQINSALRGVTTPPSVGSGFQFGAAGLAALDFLLIPAIYLSAFILNQKVPFTVTNNFKWGYSAVALGLALTAALVPAAAPIIGVAAASLAVVVSAVLLGKALYDRYQLGSERSLVRQDIETAEVEMKAIVTKAKDYEAVLQNTTDKEVLIELYKEISSVAANYEKQKNKIQELKDKEEVLTKQIKELGILPMLDKGLAVSFSAIAVIGAVVSLFFPPVGLAILTAVTVASFSYFIGRLTMPLIINAAKSLINKIWPATPTAELGSENEPLLTPGPENTLETSATTELRSENEPETPQTSHAAIMYQLIGDTEQIKDHVSSVAKKKALEQSEELANDATPTVADIREDNQFEGPAQTNQ